MRGRLYGILVPVALSGLASGVHASESCSADFVQQYQDSVRIVGSLRPDKPGQTRVYAIDGSEFTAGQVRWMQGQLQLSDRACTRGDQATASTALNAVQQLVRAHRRTSLER